MRENIYEKVIAAALLKFEKLDNMDIHIFCKNIMSKLDNERTYCYCNSYCNLLKFIKICGKKTIDSGTISLRENFTIDSVIDKDYLSNQKDNWQTIDKYYYDGITLKELFERFCDEKLIKEYFDNLDVEQYYSDKEELLKKQKDKLLSDANVLLISDDEDEYNRIKNFGYKKIDWFKSQIVADNYFNEHKEELNKYHIYIKGSHNFYSFRNFMYEKELEKKGNVLRTSYFTYDEGNQNYYEYNFRDELTHNSWNIYSPDYNDILHNVVTEALMKDVLNKVDKKYLNASVIDFEYNMEKPFPEKTEDLKVQYLETYEVPLFKDEISKDLNLNITFNPDNNDGIENHIFKNMGDYDIIIASHTYSGRMLSLAKEAEEQLKYTGRKMALLVTYEYESIWALDENGEYNYENFSEQITLKYIFVGPAIENNKSEQKQFNLLKGEDPDKKKVKAILQSAIEIYNDKLRKMGEAGFGELDYKTIEDYEKEYEGVKEKHEQKVQELLTPIKDFNKMASTVDSYLRYKSWLEEDDKTFNIIERENDMVTIEQIEENKVVARITYIYKGPKKTYVDFIFSYEDANHYISDKKRYGFYTSKHNNDLFLPEKPDESAILKINQFEKKIEEVLQPLYSTAWDKYCEHVRYIEEQEQKIREFDRLYNTLLNYFKYTSNRTGNISFDGFQVSQNDEGIKVALMFSHRCVGAVTFKKGYGNDSRKFLVEQINKKGVLSNPQPVGYSADGKLKEPDEKQLLIINKVTDVINNQIVPLNNQLQVRYSECSENEISFNKPYGKKYRRW